MGKIPLKIRVHKRELGLKEDCVMNISNMCHE